MQRKVCQEMSWELFLKFLHWEKKELLPSFQVASTRWKDSVGDKENVTMEETFRCARNYVSAIVFNLKKQ